MSVPAEMPRWNLESVFPSLDSPEFHAAFEAVREEIQALAVLYDELGIREMESQPAGAAGTLETVIGRLNALYDRYITVRSYLNCQVSSDAANDAAQSRMSELRMATVTLSQLESRFTAWIGSLDLEAVLAESAFARDYAFLLRKSHHLARHQMAEGEENLYADLQPAGLRAWARLHSDVTSLLEVPITLRGEAQRLPMPAVRALENDPEREVRRTAYEAELKAWETVAVPLAAAMNGVKGFQSVANRRRGFADDVEPTLIANHITRASLEAMQAACVESFPDFRRYMAAKARALGLEKLTWYDVAAPVGAAGKQHTWQEAEEFTRKHFAHYSEEMRGLADRAFREGWIDWGSRTGKEGGAYCTGIRRGESRILMNYDGSYNWLSTLAHELGHAYHNLQLGIREPLQRGTPSTLAETASIFCETLVFDAVLESADPAERLALLDISLQRDLLVVVDIHSRFLFEKAVFARRAQRELTVRELCDLMLEAQQATYGDGLDAQQLHAYMWAVKGHYYGPMFYNYPYTFGLLFGLGLYARYQEDPETFRSGYNDLLSSTGLADAATLTARFGMDCESVEFWRSSLDVIRRSIAEFERLTGSVQ